MLYRLTIKIGGGGPVPVRCYLAVTRSQWADLDGTGDGTDEWPEGEEV